MEKCFRCARSDEEVRLFDGFYGMEGVKVCERCSLIENMPIIKIHNASEFNQNIHQTVRQRLSKMAGIDSGNKKEKSIHEKLKDLDEQPELEKPENITFKLIDNFHWHVLRERRRRCLSQKQLSEAIKENEEVIKMIEKNALPKGALLIIQKLERFLGIRLIKISSPEKMYEGEKNIKPIDLPPAFNPSKEEVINQHEHEFKDMKKQEAEDMLRIAIQEETNPVLISKEQIAGTPLKLVDFKRRNSEDLRLADLKRMQERVELDSPIKNKIQIGKEQTAGMNEDEVEIIKKTAYHNYGTSSPKKPDSKKTPTISELAKQKQERDKELIGRDIDLAREEKEGI